MSQRLGAERCFMAHPSGAYIMWIIGSGNINTRLEQGWTIHPSERNHLTRSQDPKEVEATDTVKQEPKRPRIKR